MGVAQGNLQFRELIEGGVLRPSSPGLTGDQYSRAPAMDREALEYWATRWSLSSGGAQRRPGGGW